MKFGRLDQVEEDASLQEFINSNTFPTIKFQDAYKFYLQNLNIELLKVISCFHGFMNTRGMTMS